jgi:hypothetical protein
MVDFGQQVDNVLRDHRVLISGFGDDGRGGLFAFDGSTLESVDALETTGLAFGNGNLARLLRAPGELTSIGELLVSDVRGVVEYRRLDDVVDPHDICADGSGGWFVVSTGTNSIVRVDAASVAPMWSLPGAERDACHVNCLVTVDGHLHATAFGRSTHFKAWRDAGAEGRGVLWRVGSDVSIGGLTHPHTPRRFDDRWFLCESLHGIVAVRDDSGSVLATCSVGGYSRGMAFIGDMLFVGASAQRSGNVKDAHIAVVDLDTFSVVERVPVPCSEIYDLLLVPTDIVGGATKGFATNAFRIAQDQATLLGGLGRLSPERSEAGRWLDSTECACEIACRFPTEVPAKQRWELPVTVRNTGTAWLGSVKPHPVLVASRWIDAHDTQVDGDRIPLPEVIGPGDAVVVRLPLTAPTRPGAYRVLVSLVQEENFWFDDIDARYGESISVQIA